MVILGHSEGATLAPVAASRLDHVRGVIAFAALAFAVDSLVIAQLRANPEVPANVVEEVEDAFQQLRDGHFPEGGHILGGGEAYWREWIHLTERADSIALALGRPMFVKQGLADEAFPGDLLHRNIQVWEAAADRSDWLAFRALEDVTHHGFAASTTAPAPEFIESVILRLLEGA